SNAVLEAMVAGCACLTSDIAANAQLIEHGVTGLLFRSEDVASLARRLGDLLADEALRRRLGDTAGRVGAERYSIEAVGRRYQEVYQRLLTGQPLGAEVGPTIQK